MTEKHTYRNPGRQGFISKENGWAIDDRWLAGNDPDQSAGTNGYDREGWDVEITFTKKVAPFKPGLFVGDGKYNMGGGPAGRFVRFFDSPPLDSTSWTRLEDAEG